jgi:hypothetical protein
VVCVGVGAGAPFAASDAGADCHAVMQSTLLPRCADSADDRALPAFDECCHVATGAVRQSIRWPVEPTPR